MIGVPFTTRIRRLPWRVLFPRGAAGLPAKCEAACELVGQWSKTRFRIGPSGEAQPIGGPASPALLRAVFEGLRAATGY